MVNANWSLLMSQGILRGTPRVPPKVPPHAKTYWPKPTQTAARLEVLQETDVESIDNSQRKLVVDFAT